MKYNDLYLSELYDFNSQIKKLSKKNLCISGATGLIGAYLIDSLLVNENNDIKIIALVRNLQAAEKQFSKFANDERLIFIKINLNDNIEIDYDIDYIVHAASMTGPINYSLHPVEIMEINILGTNNLLKLAQKKRAKFIFISSSEVYGTNVKFGLKEDEYGYVDILNPRSCYNEAKKASETLCVSYNKEYGVDVVILRLSRVYGPTMKINDSKALSQFIIKTLNSDDIILKSDGTQLFNYTYVSDVVSAILIVLDCKNKSMAYNVSSSEVLMLKEVAEKCAKLSRSSVKFELPDQIEQTGYSKAMVSSLDSSAFVSEFQWECKVKFEIGIEKTINILKKFVED